MIEMLDICLIIRGNSQSMDSDQECYFSPEQAEFNRHTLSVHEFFPFRWFACDRCGAKYITWCWAETALDRDLLHRQSKKEGSDE